jgi:hypothetical protein
MNDPRFPPVRISLVEQKEWKPYDPSETSSNWTSDAAWEDFTHMETRDLEPLIDDLSEAKNEKGRSPRRKLTSEEVEWLAVQVKEGNGALEETKQAITDALNWMYEAAALPSDSDIEEAMEKAAQTVVEEFSLDVDLWESVLEVEGRRRGPKEWSPRKRFESEHILGKLLDRVTYERKENHYDRYLVFDFRNAQPVHDVLSRSGWPADRIIPELTGEFQSLRIDYTLDVFSELKKIMEDIDVSNRTDWRKAWKSMLTSGIAVGVQKEMYAALKEMPDAS